MIPQTRPSEGDKIRSIWHRNGDVPQNVEPRLMDLARLKNGQNKVQAEEVAVFSLLCPDTDTVCVREEVAASCGMDANLVEDAYSCSSLQEMKVADIDTLTPDDKQQLWEWNAAVPSAVERCIHDLFAEQAAAQPNAPAICAWDGELTFSELDTLSTRLARHLARLGVKAESIVPLCFEKSMWAVVAILAVLKAGGAFVLLDPDHPSNRHKDILAQTKASLVLTSTQYASLWKATKLAVVTVSSASITLMNDEPSIGSAAAAATTPSNAAYVIFTSGSTGTPKGVVIEHQALATSCREGERFGLTQHTRALQFASYTFDACIAEIITTLLFGGCVCVPSEADRHSSLSQVVSAMNVNWAVLTPSIARLLEPTKVSCLDVVILAGENVSLVDWQRWADIQVMNAYGPTECCICCTVYADVHSFTSGAIGTSVASVCWVVDINNHEQLASVGAVGELLVEGPILARGYLNDAEKTRTAFIEDPAWLLAGGGNCPGRRGRLYKTGDLVRYDPDGNLIYVGRKDAQVKVRGQRVELGEVEHHVRECMPETDRIAVEVILPEGHKNNAMLAVFLELDDEFGNIPTPPTDEKTKASSLARVIFPVGTDNKLAERLPGYMVPAVYFAIAQMPMTMSGKTDRKRLREIGASFSAQQLVELRTLSQGVKRAPTTGAEQAMQQLWARVLNIKADSIGLDDSFFRLGGDSIAAMKLVGEARRHGVQLTVAGLFRHPRLEQCTSMAISPTHDSPIAIPRVDHEGPVEQSFAQGRLWFLEQLYPSLTWYLMPFAVRIKGPLQLAALKSALLAVEYRHETLRTTFATVGGKSVQVVKPFRSREVNVIDVAQGDKQGIANTIQQDQAAPFDLAVEPGWRVSIYRIDQYDHVLSIVMHHIVSDGWSVDVLTRELGACYSAAVRGQDPLSQMQPLSIQYRDFSVWQRQQAQVDEHDRQLEYWVAQLQTSRPAELLCDKPRPATLSGHADVRTLEVDALLFARLQEFCEARGVTLFVVLLAAFRATHFRLTGQEDATIGTANANRDRSELRDMIGFFVNMQCLRITVEDETFEELVQQVQEVVVASLAGQDVPFERIVSKLKKERDLSRHPLVQLIFAVHSQRDLGKLMLEGVETESMSNTATSRFDLEFHFFQNVNGLRGEVIFSTDLYASETIENMLSLFRHILDTCLKEPKVVVASMALLTEANYTQLDEMGLVRVEQTAYPCDSNIVDLFRQQASAHPSRIAVKDASEEMSYAQLDAASDVLAGWLAKLSFAPETLVGVFAARSCQTIVAFLGILKANLAYLPFDVKIPAGRMKAILSSLPSGQRVVLVGADVQPPDIKLNTVKFVRIVGALEEQANEMSVPQEPTAPAAGPLATSLAYVMFTSGSTGQPKGVMVEHRGIVRLVRDNNLVQHLPVLPETRVMAHVTALAFDVSTWEIYACLLNGGTLVCVDPMTVLDPVAVSQIFHRTNINMAVLTPALFRHYVQEAPAVLTNLEMLCLGGEALHPRDASEALRLLPGKAVNCYGPTENTGISAIFVLTEEEHCVNGVPIGRALSNSGAHVMDPDLRLVPLGVIGELVVTGDGLARGYTDPERNIDRFVSVTIASQTVKAYRTGDYARHRVTDGQLEYFGRMDGQVKIRGQRIELGEIEHVLRSQKRVSDAVAVRQQRDGDDVRLAGFIIVDEDAAMADSQVDDGDGNDGDEDESQHVETWEQQFDNDIYSPINNIQSERIGRDFTGWTSMYDGSEIDEIEMNEWLDDTIHTMLNGSKPGSVVEIGSGTGMVLFNLGDDLQSYVGLDPSRKAIEFVVKTAKSIPALAGKVRLHRATAMDIGRLEPSVTANLASLNSVVQYFPSQEYLFKVVQELLQVSGIQTIFFGDVRSYALHREFLATRALRMAGDKATMADIRRMVTDMERVEAELLVDPAFFTALPGRLPELVEHVEILPKRMKATNELSCYRYAAVIHVRSRSGPKREIQVVKEDEWIDFSERKLDRQSLRQQLISLSGLSVAAVSNIPYSKTIVSRCLVEALDDMDADTRDAPGWLSSVYHQAQHKPSLSATDLVELAQESGCRVEISWNRQYSQRGSLDAIFHRSPPRNGENRRLFRFPTEHTDRPPHNLSSRPLRQRVLKKIQQQLLAMLQAQLPAYMVPQVITVLDAMPVTQNGKVDRKALEQRVQTERISKAPVQQSISDGELRMQKLWAGVLGVAADSIGLDDSFFRLGGDSIAAMKLVGEARRHGVHLTVADLFRCPKLAALASLDVDSRDIVVEEQIAAFSLLSADADAVHVREEVATSCGIDANLIEDAYPCSPLQEGLMSLTAKRAGDYIMQSVLELRADVDEHAFRAAWEQVVQSTAVLRTRIVQHSELGLMQAVVTEDIQWIETEGLEAYLDKDKSTSMGLGDLLARYAVVKERRRGQEEGAAAGKRWFVWTVHHALYDGWSLPRIMGAVEKAYRGADMQKQPGFRAFIKHLSRQDPHEAAAYWQNALADCEATPFPALPVAVQQPVADATVHYQCPPLPKTASDTTMSTLVRAAWAVLASQYTGLDDVVFGAVVTGRNAAMAGIEAMLGPTIATVPVRVRIERGQSVRAFVEGVQQQAMEMMPHEQTGLQRIAKIGADARHACGFQTLLVVQPAEDGLVGDSVLGAWRGNSELHGFTTYALMVQCTLAAEGMRITASFDERVIERWLVGKILGQLSFVMQQLAAADAEMKVADIDTLTPDDKQQLWEWNAAVPSAVERCIHDLFAKQAAAQPNAPAICAWDGELTYSELDVLSTRLASHLVSLGIKAESVVPLCFEKSIWTVVAMLAVLKAGGAFVPLDPDHPSNRHKDILAQTKASLVLTSTQYASLWKATELEVVIVSEAGLRRLSVGNGRAQNMSRPGNAAYVIFTSGSTGTPKGVVLQHQAVSTGCLGHGEAFGFTQHTRALQFASYTFDACITEIFTTLVFGGCVCVPSEGDRRDRLVSVINSLSINWALLTPSVARLLDPGAVPMLKVLVMGGEHVLSSDWKRWAGTATTINAYGPAECCVCCTVYADVHSFTSGAIGTSVASVCWVVDINNHEQLASVGAVGELLVEGPILARGYLNDDDKTRAAFVQDPAWLLAGGGSCPGRRGRLYKTGDLVRYDSDGNLVYMGRKDGQVKVRGQRVELGEVEHHVRECMPAAERVAVEVVLPTGEGASAVLAAFLQLDSEESKAVQTDEAAKTGSMARVIFPASADAKLAKQLPSYMVPQVYFAVVELPTTTSGKTDRRRLREIGALFSTQQLAELQTANGGGGAKQAPSTEAERTMQQLWARVLNIKPGRIGLDDSFFRLGGDSITAMQLSVSARRFHIHLSTRDVFEKKTIRQLARNVDAGEPLALPTATRDATNTLFHLSPIQELYLSLESTGKACFDQHFFLRLSDPTQKELLHSAFCTLVDRHSMLRARFCRPNDGAWQQYISDHVGASFAVQYVQSSDPEVITQAIANSRSSLDIENGPVVAAVLCDEGGQQSLFAVAHHLVIDLVSWRVLLEELEELLLNRALPPVSSLSFPTWVTAQTEYITKHADFDSASHAEEHKSQLSYWDAHPDTVTYGNTVTEQFTLDSWTTSALLGDCNEAYETRPFELMIAALAHSFALAFTDRCPPTIFTETHGREVWDDSIDLMRTVGWFTSMYPVQASRSREDSLLRTICQTKDCTRAFKHSGWLYFASQFADQRRADAFKSVFPVEVMFNYSGVYQQLERKESLLKQGAVPGTCGPASMAATPRFSLFEVSCHIENGCAHVAVVSDSTVRYQDRIRDWVQQYKTTLLGMPSLLQGRGHEWTLSDLPLAFTSYQDLDHFSNHTLAGLHIRTEDVEDVYPCSPMQQGILISQSKDGNAYRSCFVFEAVSLQDTDVDCSRLQQAWRAVVKRHSLLRTLLVDNVPGSSGTTNVVLKNPEPAISFYRAAESTATIELFRARGIPGPQQASGLQHHLSICQLENGRVYLCLDINHAIFDGHAKGVLLRDLQSAYSADLDPHNASFRDVVSYLVQQPQESALQYWVGYLRGIEPCHFPSMADGEGGTCRDGVVQVKGLDMNDIHAFCQQWELTPATIIQTAWALVLAAYTGSKDPCFGTLSSGRDLPIDKVQEIVCPMINMLVCRLTISEEQTALGALRSVQEDYSNSLPHQTFPLANVHSALQLGTSALFNTALSLQRADAVQKDGEATIMFREQEGLDPTEYDIVVGAAYDSMSLAFGMQFRTSCMSQEQAERVAGTFGKAIKELITRPDSRISDLTLLADQDVSQLWAWSGEVPVAVERCIHDLFTEQAAAQPNAPAICAWDGELTYSELDALSTRLASHLVRLGVKAESVVPLCFEKSMWTVVAMLAVLKAGGAFVPLDPAHPRSRYDEILKQTKASVLLTSARYEVLWQHLELAVVIVSPASITLMNDEPSIGSAAAAAAAAVAAPSNAAYVIFTSGSTGTPKGVVIEHQALATSCREGERFGLTQHTRALQFASYTFDACIAEIITTLLFGGCVCVPSETDRHGNLSQVVSAMNVNWTVLTPSVARLLEPTEVSCLDVVTLAGEHVSSVDWQRWAGYVQVMNAYGPTECCICCAVYTDNQPFKSGTIGKPVASVCWVVDPEDYNQLVPLGSVGELLVEGPILARGYLNDDDKTRAAFVQDPAWLLAGGGDCPGRRGRLYKTGDLVCYDPDGNLVYMGRKDNQVKVRGQRVELGEVEHHLREFMAETQQLAVEVIAPGGEKKNAALAAFLQMDEVQLDDKSEEYDGGQDAPAAGEPDMLARVVFPREVEEQMLKRLPEHMVPSVYFAVGQLPMTVSGKTDRKRLREIGASFSAQQLAELRTASEGAAKRAPTTEAERTMQQLWAGVLGVAADSIGLDDSFFRLGGDSIAAMKLVGEARRHGVQLIVADLFRHPTLAQISQAGLASPNSSPQPVPPFSLVPFTVKDSILYQSSIRQEHVADILPTTHVQRLFVNWGIESPHEAFNYFFLDIGPQLDAQLLHDSCRRLVDHFPILRSQFISFREKLWQVILLRPQLCFTIFEVDGSLSEATRRICLEDIHKADPLALPTSFTLLRDKLVGHRLIVRLSHAQYDGVCAPVILKTLAALYAQETPPIAPSFSTYLAHARTQRDASARYWRELLKGSRMTRATARLRPKAGGLPALDNIKVERVIRAPRLPHNITMASLLSSAWALVLSSITGEEDVVYGHTVAGRNSDIPGITEIVGPCLNVVPVRVRIQPAKTPADLICYVHEQHASLGQADSAQLDEIVHECTDWPAGSEFDSVVQHQNIDEHPGVCFAGATTKVQWFDNPFWIARQLYFFSLPQADQLKLTVAGNTHILTAEAAHSILDMLATTIAELSRNIDEPLALCRFPFPLCL